MANTKTASFVTITDLNDSVPLIRGTQAAVTGAWTGVAPFRSLENGQQISYLLPFGGTGNATLNLTLDGGGTTGAIACYYGGTRRLTTQYGAGNIIRLTYIVNNLIAGTNYTGWWADANYTGGNNYDRTLISGATKAGTGGVTASRFVVADDTGYRDLAVGSVFDITKPILWARYAVAAGASSTSSFYSVYPTCPISQGQTSPAQTNLTTDKIAYIKGTMSGNWFTVTGAPIFTDVVPTTEDGFIYYSVGRMSTTTNCLLGFDHGLYYYKNGAFTPYVPTANAALSILQDISSDNKLTPVEKKEIKREWDAIVAEKSKIEQQATSYGVEVELTDYTTQYDTLSAYLTPLLADLTTTNDIVGTILRQNFTDYYDKRQLVLNRITVKSQESIQVGGRNLVIRADELKDKVIDIGGSTVDEVGFAVMSNTIQVEPGKVYAFSKSGSEEPGDNYWRYNLLDEEGNYISTLTNSANAFYWVAPADVFSIQVSYPTDAFPQIEQGNVITGWTPAPEDVSDSLVDLTTAISKTTSIHYTTSLSNFIVDPDMTVGSIVYEIDAQKVWRYEGLGKVAPYPPIWTDITSVMLGQALTIALNTQQTVDGKITTFAQATQPIIVSVKPGDTWINSELLFPNVLFYENGAWMNKQIEMSFIQNSTPKATLAAGETWLNTVGKKIYAYGNGEWNDTGELEDYRYIQKTAPVFSTSEEIDDNMGAQWVNLTNNTIYIFNGVDWLISSPVVKYTYVQGWIPKVRATSDKWYDIITGDVKVFNGINWEDDTQTITFFTNLVPRTTVNIGDLWFDTGDGNKVYRAEGDESEGITWRSYQDSFISETNNNLSNMLKFITGGNNVFNDIHEPTGDATFGDLWYDGTGWKIYDNEQWVAYDRPYLLDDIRESYLVTYDDDIITQKVESAFDAIWTNTDLPSSYISRSELTQTDSNLRIAIGTMISDGTEDLSLGLTNLTDDYTRTVGTYFDFKSDGLSIKSLSDNPDEANLYIKIDNKEIGFWQGDLEVAYISSNKMYIENAHVLHTLTLGAGSGNEQEGYVDFDTKNQGLSAIWRPYV